MHILMYFVFFCLIIQNNMAYLAENPPTERNLPGIRWPSNADKLAVCQHETPTSMLHYHNNIYWVYSKE